jgi:hypothetical protein
MKSRFVRSAAVLPMLLFLAGACGDSTGPGLPPGVRISPSKTVFPIERVNGLKRVTITGAIRNEGEWTVYYQYCGERIAKRLDGNWVTVWSPVCPSIAIPPAPIPPGASYEFGVSITEPLNLPVEFPLDENGIYRIEVGLFLKVGTDEFEPIRASRSVSTTFRVTE